MTDELDVTNYDLEAERTARREAGERSTKAIRDMISAVGEHAYGIASAYVGRARAELAAILKRIEELERSAEGWEADALNYAKSRGCQEAMTDAARDRNVDLEKQIAVMRETLLDIALCGDSLPMDATPDEHDAAIISMRDMASAALVPDTGKRVVDVAWLKAIEWGDVCDIRGFRHCYCPECGGLEQDGHKPDCTLAELIGEGE